MYSKTHIPTSTLKLHSMFVNVYKILSSEPYLCKHESLFFHLTASLAIPYIYPCKSEFEHQHGFFAEFLSFVYLLLPLKGAFILSKHNYGVIDTISE